MSKKGVLRITGNTSPKTGVKTFYKVTEWYPNTPLSERKESLVTWELFRKRENGKFTSTNIKKKVGEFTFGKDAWKYTFRVEGYLHDSEGKEPMSIIVQPQKNDKKAAPKEKDILGVKLTFQDGTPVNKKLSYKDRLWATAKCQGMEGEYITFSLWEDDEIGEGHNKKNQFILKSSPVQVDSKGYARWNFALLNTYIAIANKRENDKKQHEYYVTAEYNGKLKASDNAHANNPEYKAPPVPPKKPTGNNGGKPQPKLTPPKPKPDSPKGSTRPNSPNNQPDKKGEITQIKLTDINGKDFTKNPKFGETIKVSIKSKNLIGKKCTLKIWEHDLIGDDLLYSRDHTFSSDNLDVLIPLTDKMQKTGEIGNDPKNPDKSEYWQGGQQEIFAEVIILNISSKSKIIDVDIMEAPKKQDDGITATKKEKNSPATNKVCECEEFKLIWGKKVSCKFRKKVVAIAKDLWPDDYKNMANNLMAVFAWETGGTFKTDIPNRKGSGATGLIQFLPERAQEYLGKCTMEKVPNYFNSKDPKLHNLPRVKEFAEMKPENQLDYVKKYFEDIRGKKLEFVDFYLKVLFPASMLKPEHYVFGLEKFKNEIGLANDSEKVRQKRVDKYSTNSGMDTFKDGKISKSEIALSIQPFITKGILEIFTKEGNIPAKNDTDSKSISDAVIVTDAGHGINGDGGNSKKGNADSESKMTLMIESETAKALTSKNFTAVRTRSTETLSVSENQITYRVNVAKKNKAKVFISHHLDYVPMNKDGTVNEKGAKSTNRIVINIHPTNLVNDKGTSISGGASADFYKNSSSLADKIVTELKKVFTDREVIIKQAKRPNISHDWLGVLKNMDGSDRAAVLIELGNTLESNTKYLTDNKEAIGRAIATGVEIYLGVQPEKKKDPNLECDSDSAPAYVPGAKVETPSNYKWHHPVKNPQLRGSYSIWAPERSIHSSNIPGRTKGKHDGIDLYAPTGTPVYACVDGEINEIYVSETYGNCINIKGQYNGKTLWFFYAHLSSISIKAKDSSGNPTKVKAGDPIGKSGKTGATASALKPNQVHLHFEVRTIKERTDGRVDPFTYISELDKEVIKNPKKENQP